MSKSIHVYVQLLHPLWKHFMSTYTMIVLLLLSCFIKYDLQSKKDKPHIPKSLRKSKINKILKCT